MAVFPWWGWVLLFLGVLVAGAFGGAIWRVVT
jgi:hypothetical protein